MSAMRILPRPSSPGGTFLLGPSRVIKDFYRSGIKMRIGEWLELFLKAHNTWHLQPLPFSTPPHLEPPYPPPPTLSNCTPSRVPTYHSPPYSQPPPAPVLLIIPTPSLPPYPASPPSLPIPLIPSALSSASSGAHLGSFQIKHYYCEGPL